MSLKRKRTTPGHIAYSTLIESQRVVVGVLNQKHFICRLPDQDQTDLPVKYKNFYYKHLTTV